MGHPDHCRWLRLAWVHRHSQILTRSFDIYIVSWSLLWFPVVSWCSLFKRERCKLMQDHARKSKILYFIYIYNIYIWWAVWGRVFEIVAGCMDFTFVQFAWDCLVWMAEVFEKCKLDYFRCWKWWCFAERPPMSKQSSLHFLITSYPILFPHYVIGWHIESECDISCKAFFCLPRLALHLKEHLLRTTWGT